MDAFVVAVRPYAEAGSNEVLDRIGGGRQQPLLVGSGEPSRAPSPPARRPPGDRPARRGPPRPRPGRGPRPQRRRVLPA
ncbi:hypothetical protein ADK59_18940 [Streptomyces sp. XY332]|nr:hypothetical protein ADK59_18940 [Streptomyces sp. XY332]